jgi:hypothetical protein
MNDASESLYGTKLSYNQSRYVYLEQAYESRQQHGYGTSLGKLEFVWRVLGQQRPRACPMMHYARDLTDSQ